jgi:hypothetical protein
MPCVVTNVAVQRRTRRRRAHAQLTTADGVPHTRMSASKGVEEALKFLAGRWKLMILFQLFGGEVRRFSELQRAISHIGEDAEPAAPPDGGRRPGQTDRAPANSPQGGVPPGRLGAVLVPRARRLAPLGRTPPCSTSGARWSLIDSVVCRKRHGVFCKCHGCTPRLPCNQKARMSRTCFARGHQAERARPPSPASRWIAARF